MCCFICPLWVRDRLALYVMWLGEAFDSKADSCFDRVVWYAGPVLVCVGFFLTFALSLCGVGLILPVRFSAAHFNNDNNTASVYELACKLVVLVGVLNILVRYIYAVFTNPGNTESTAYARLLQKRTIITTEEKPTTHPMLKWTKCRITGAIKPPRSHFDSVNGKLVLGFDHWCPWLFNSVGYANYRHFVWLLVWVYALTLMGVLLTVDLVLVRFKRHSTLLGWKMDWLVLVEFAFCLALNMAVGMLLAWHLYLASTAQTSVDYLVLTSRRRREGADIPNPFCTGSAYINLRGVLLSEHGWGWLEFLIPPNPKLHPLNKPFPDAEW